MSHLSLASPAFGISPSVINYAWGKLSERTRQENREGKEKQLPEATFPRNSRLAADVRVLARPASYLRGNLPRKVENLLLSIQPKSIHDYKLIFFFKSAKIA